MGTKQNKTPKSLGPDRRIILTILRDIQCDSVDQIHMSQDKVQWQAFIHHKVPYKP